MNDTAYATDKVLYVSTSSYASDSSDYVSSVVTDTPFPSITKSQKLKINELIHGGRKATPKVSTFTPIEENEPTNENADVKNSCCCLC